MKWLLKVSMFCGKQTVKWTHYSQVLCYSGLQVGCMQMHAYNASKKLDLQSCVSIIPNRTVLHNICSFTKMHNFAYYR